MILLIILCTFGAVTLLILGVTMKSSREIIKERLDGQTGSSTKAKTAIEMEMEVPFRERVTLPFLRKLSTTVSRFTPAGAIQAIDEKLDTAGRPWRIGATEFLGLKVLSLIIVVIGGFFFVKILNVSFSMQLILGLLIVIIALTLPDYLLQGAINNRQSKIRRVLPDTLDLLTVSVEAGLGLDGAMQRVIEKLDNPLSVEMNRALQEMQVGKARAVALKDMAKRNKVPELTSFVAAVVQADQLGVSISNVLRVQGETLRNVRSQRARETAAKIPVKMLFPLVFCIFPAIFVVVLFPAIFSIAKGIGAHW